MSYFLGIDLGTTYTAAAVWRAGRVEVASLGGRAPVIPSVLLLREDGEVLTGEAAARRATVEPHRIAREFKRRIGDPTPIIVAGAPYSADALTAKLLRVVAQRVADDQDGPPAGLGISHPANWGNYKKDLLRQAIHQAGLGEVTLLTEPEAAAIHYASQERVELGSVVAVYDLGGGTFDAAVLRRTVAGWEILGQPEGIERLGGVDFDQAVFHHVTSAIGAPYDCLDPDDPTARAAVTRLRQDCVDAKEALASDTDVTIPVLLPTLHTEIRLTRAEFEDMIRPALADSITALQRALGAAAVRTDEVSAVLLVGGSSRIPLVAQLVGSAFGRPVAVDAHPKHGVALGAAIIAADHASPGAVNTSEVEQLEEAPRPASFWIAPTTPTGGTSAVTLGNRLGTPALAAPAPTALLPAPNGTGMTVSMARPPDALPELGPADGNGRGHRALGLLLGGAAALAVAVAGMVTWGRGDDSGQAPADPDGAPVIVSPGGPETTSAPRSSSSVSTETSTSTTSAEVRPPTTAARRPATPTSVEPSTTTTEAPTSTTESTTTTERSTTTTTESTTTTSTPP